MISTLPLLSLVVSTAVLASSHAHARDDGDGRSHETTYELVQKSDVDWGALNPARGDKSPRSGDLWGDRTGSGATGFLVTFNEGFSSPPHIHNVTYRGIVITGLVHNGDPEAEMTWMPAGSYWSQPAGDVHVTAADGGQTLAYIEIDAGPYLVDPPEDGFDNGERPVNIDQTNLVWVDASNFVWVEQPETPSNGSSAQVAFVWGTAQGSEERGTLIKLPSGSTGTIDSQGTTVRAITIKGQIEYRAADANSGPTLEPGSYFGSNAEATHHVSCDAEKDCILYVRSNGAFNLTLS